MIAVGLCRTCQIFSVQGLVLSNVTVLEDKQFQSVSVTAEKWLPFQEVSGPLQMLASVLIDTRLLVVG